MPMIYEPELELSMSNSNRYKHIERAQIDIYMRQYKQYYTVYKEKDWEMLPQRHQGVMNSWHILKTYLKRGEIVRYSNGWNHYHPNIKSKKSRSTIPKRRRQPRKKPQELLPASPKPTHFPKKGGRNRKRTGENHIPQATAFQKSKKMPWRMSSTWPEP
ncbi:hypothetical protein O181_125908 [Austropuccinia psidii MF-1]|uniref:Uncharacterized protein n=1 Tax=Austropuccinia psidii MF-1 TaxID=1389203 RepID=A0A9Q3KRI5_9BASI|nr:hypothetical protein [Austropuccinia psidii MF-1]